MAAKTFTRDEAIQELAEFFLDEQCDTQCLEEIAIYGRTGFSTYSNAELGELLIDWPVTDADSVEVTGDDVAIADMSGDDKADYLIEAIRSGDAERMRAAVAAVEGSAQ